jgi:hypothetical protein
MMLDAQSSLISNSLDTKIPILTQKETWSKILGKLFPNEEGFSIQQVREGGYILVGAAYQANGGVWLVKMDIEGDIEWETHLGGNYTTGKYVEETKDGGFIIAAEGRHGILLLKTDAYGNEIWSQLYPNGLMWRDRLVQQTEDRGYILIATNDDKDDFPNAWLIKTDGNGNELWNRTYGGTDTEFGGSVRQTTD